VRLLSGQLLSVDSWLFQPSLILLTALTVASLCCGIPGPLSLLLIPLSLIGFPIAGIVCLGLAAVSFWKRAPRKGASYLLAILLSVALFRPINWISDVIHVGLSAGLGVGQIGKSYQSADDRFVAYDWSVGLVPNGDTFLIFDATDEILLPLSQHVRLKESKAQYVEMCSGQGQNHSVSHLIGHYYICTWG
jgi:hypothetical protein